MPDSVAEAPNNGSRKGVGGSYLRVEVSQYGGPDVLHVVEGKLPMPGRGEARVKVLAADVSFSDVNIRRGRYPGGPRPPFTPGYAMAGIIDRLGEGTDRPAQGQAVAALTFYGAYSQYIILPVEDLVSIPSEADPAEAASLVLSYVAAYQMLHRVAHVQKGQRILVHGAAGGVGTAFLELGRLAGLEVFGTASKSKHNLVLELGARPIDYRTEDFVERVRALTGGAGVDCVFDPIGASHLRHSAEAVRNGGTIVAYGFYEASNRGRNAVLDVLSQYMNMAIWSLPPQRKHAAFYDIRPMARKHPDWFTEDLKTLAKLLVARRIKPVIAARVPLNDVVAAHEQVERAQVKGKIILMPNMGG